MSQKAFYRTLCGFTIVNCIYLLLNIFISSIAMADDLEHLHASWLVWQGQVPYRDFFEHHHPLMWYVFAPVIGMFERNILVFFAIRLLMVVVSLATLYGIYRLIKDFMADKITALLAINIFCFSNTALSLMVQFKPDTLMALFFVWGVYALFVYLRDKQQSWLNWAAMFFTLAFLFLQTALFLLLPLVVVVGWLLIKQEIAVKDALCAAVAPLIILGAAVGFLYYEGNLQRYYELNWVVNAQIAKELGIERIADFSSLYWILACGMAAMIWVLRKGANRYLYILAAMYVVEFALRVFYLSPYLYYFRWLLMYNAIWVALALIKLWRWRAELAYVWLVVLLIFSGKFWLFESVGEFNTLTVVGVVSDISRNSTAEDKVLGTKNMPFGVFNQNAHYYWFSWPYIGQIDENLFGYAPPFDINRIIEQEEPLFVYFDDDLRPNYRAVTQYDIRPELLDEGYETAKYNVLYKRKNPVAENFAPQGM